MKVLTLKVSEALDEGLAVAARERGGNKSAVVRQALEDYLAARGRRAVRRGSFLDRARGFAGCVEGVPDLSTNRRQMAGYGR